MDGHPGGLRKKPWGTAEGWRGILSGVAGRALRSAGLPGLSLRPPPARPPGCAPAPPLTAAPGRGRPRQLGTWATGSRREGAPAPRWSSALTSPRLAPPLGCGGPAATAPRGSRRAGDAGLPPQGRWGPQGADGERACGWAPGARAHSEPLGRTAGSGVDARSLESQQGKVAPVPASRGASGRKRAPSTCCDVRAVATECSGRLLARARCLGSTWGHFQ